MIYVLVALESELDAKDLPESCTIRYTGVGKVNATIHACWAVAQTDCEKIVNFGTAGVLRRELAGFLHQIKSVRQRDMDPRPLAELGQTPYDHQGINKDIEVASAGLVLGSGDQFVKEPPELRCDLVDMEAYAIAKVAKLSNIPIEIYKYGSDFADENAAEDWEENQKKGAKLFIEQIKFNL